ncbi:alanine--glyoxylate aminotransferase family protein [soil metagenome]
MENEIKYFTCGPTELYPDTEKWLKEALNKKLFSLTHRGAEFEKIFQHSVHEQKKLMNIPETHAIFFMSGATECMERVIENLVENKSAHFVNGAFAERFHKTALDLKKSPYLYSAEWGNGNDLTADLPSDAEMICITQNETSTGTATPMEDIYSLKTRYSEKIFILDIVTSAPNVDIDFSKIDGAFFSVQKGFGMPAGLGVMIINKKCIEKTLFMMEMNYNVGSYNNFVSAYNYYLLDQTTVTPNTVGIYLIGKVCEYLNKYGIEKIRRETKEKADLYYNELEGVKGLEFFVSDKKHRSETIIVLNTGSHQKEIKKRLKHAGFMVSSGYGKLKDTQIRIANFPMHKMEDCRKIVEVLKSPLP